MFEKLYAKLIPVAKARYIWPGVVLIILFNTIFFPLPPRQFLENNTLSGRLLDMKFTYSPDEAYVIMESYGQEGRTLYWRMSLVVDNPYAVVYGIALMLMLILVFSLAFPDKRLFKKLAFLPILAALSDVFENGSLAYILTSFPERHDTVAKFASLCTSVKWGLIIISVLLLITGAVRYRRSR